MTTSYDAIIVGSGAGGATLARKLCGRGKQVLMLETGSNTFPPLFSIEKSIEGIDVFTAYGAGGAAALMNGNLVRSLEKELLGHGIDLQDAFAVLEEEIPVRPIHESLLSDHGSLKILEHCREAGLGMRRTPKSIDPTKCIRCGNCGLGCPTGAKWTPLHFLNEALSTRHLDVVYNSTVEKVIVEAGMAKGVYSTEPQGKKEYFADIIILAAGGLKSPIILKNSGIEKAGQQFFIDICELWFGLTPDIDISEEPPMQLIDTNHLESEGFILSTGYIKDRNKLRYYLKDRAGEYDKQGHVAVIVKICDDSHGTINLDGTFSKSATQADQAKLKRGGEAAMEFLCTIGARSDSIFKRDGMYGGHNGGSCAIGSVVDMHFQTEVSNLYVCDGSILPRSPGLPPMLTIMALSHWFGDKIV